MRKSTDPCLICLLNPASKTKSHIFPRFLSTRFLEKEGQARRGYELSSDQTHKGKTMVIQDSPKQDFILCPECEHYFSIVEGLAADTYNNCMAKVQSREFSQRPVAQDLDLVVCLSSDSRILRLLVYSLFWRASVSGHTLFQNYKLTPSLENSLQRVFFSMKSLTRTEFLEKLGQTPLPLHPYACLTAESFADATANALAAVKATEPASLNVDRFGFLLYEFEESTGDFFFLPGLNIFEEDRKILVFSEALWHEIMIKQLMGLVVEEIKAKRGMG